MIKPSITAAPSSVLHRKLPGLVFFCIGIWLGLNLLLYFNYAARMATFPYELDSGEGLSLLRAIELSQGHNIYTPISSPPYVVANYPPVHDVVIAGFVRAFGPVLLPGRLLSITSAILAGVFIYFIVWLQTMNRGAAVISGLLFPSSGWVINWSVLCRVDMIALMLSLAGMTLFIQAMRKRRGLFACLSAIFFTAALFTRQSAVAAPAACFATLAVLRWKQWQSCNKGMQSKDERKDLRIAAAFSSTLVLCFLTALVVLMALTKGELWRHVVTYTAGSYSLLGLFYLFKSFLWAHGIILALSIVYVAFRCWKRDFSVLVLFWIFSFLVALTAGKIGATINYFIELWGASCILVGLVLAGLAERSRHFKRLEEYGVLACLSLQLFLSAKAVDRTTPSASHESAGYSVEQIVSDTPGEVLSEYPGYLALANKDLHFQPFAMSQLALRGLWDQRIILQEIAERRFQVIIVSNVGPRWGRWTPEMIEMIRKHYRMVKTVSCFALHTYRHSIVELNIWLPKRGG